jgi:predicted branched-subunit amino acid permease
MPGMLAWGAVSGVAMVKGGLSVPLALLMSLLVYSAGAQLGALTLMASGAPLWLIIAATVCVNLRFVIFSAGMRPYLIQLPFARRLLLGYLCADLSYIMFMRRFAGDSGPRPGQVPYLIGTSVLNWIGWQLATVFGIVFANAIPTEWGLGYAGVLALLGLSCSLLVDRKSALSALIALIAALATQGLPLRLNIVVAIAAAVATGMLLDRAAPEPGLERA